MLKVAVVVLNIVLAVVYPLAVWWSLAHFSVRVTGLMVLGFLVPMVALRLSRADPAHRWPVLRVPLSIMALLLLGVATDDERFVLAMPVLISGALFIAFAGSLRGEMPLIERFARLQESELSPAKQHHCRQATVAWCVFFVFNAGVAGALALAAPVRWWAAYSGGIAYALMGAMFAGEYIVRKARFREFGAWPHDRLLARMFPPREDAR